MKFLKSFLFDMVLLAMVVLIGLYFSDYRWLVTFIIILLSVMLLIISIVGMASDEIKSDYFTEFDKIKYYNKTWYRLYDAITDVLMFCSLAYFQFILPTIFYVVSKIFIECLKNSYRKSKKEESEFK